MSPHWVGVCEALRQQWPGACFIFMPSRDALSTIAGCVWHSDAEVPPGSFAWTMEYCLAFCKWPSTGTSQGKRLPCCTRASVEPQGTVAPNLNRQQRRRRWTPLAPRSGHTKRPGALRQQLSDCSGKSLPHVFNVPHYFDSLFGHFPGGTIAGGGGHLRRGAGA